MNTVTATRTIIYTSTHILMRMVMYIHIHTLMQTVLTSMITVTFILRSIPKKSSTACHGSSGTWSPPSVWSKTEETALRS